MLNRCEAEYRAGVSNLRDCSGKGSQTDVTTVESHFWKAVDLCAIFFRQPKARVAQWIRAFASGAKGRRFDPCRGYQPNQQLTVHIKPFRNGSAHTSIESDSDFPAPEVIRAQGSRSKNLRCYRPRTRLP
jgi:hypothetical protein